MPDSMKKKKDWTRQSEHDIFEGLENLADDIDGIFLTSSLSVMIGVVMIVVLSSCIRRISKASTLVI